MNTSFNQKIKQVLILTLIIFLFCVSLKALYSFLPGILGAVTLYILSRNYYFKMVETKKWKKGRAAAVILFFFTLVLGALIYAGIALLGPKVNQWISDSAEIIAGVRKITSKILDRTGIDLFSESTLKELQTKLTAFVPQLFNATSSLLTNFVLMLFTLYYMLYNGKEIETQLTKLIPLKQKNITLLATETLTVVRANAIGIPLISIIQGVVATIGYMIFGVKDWALWGFLTGLFAFFPVIGTMIIWVPVVIMQYAMGDNWNATAVLIYSIVVTGNVDYLARITILKRMGNIHPMTTVLGVIVGLSLFGFVGLIFGPLLINYIIILAKIYINEFSAKENVE
ncbi:AI-2E family transporter [Ferruginibacter albus]|uniref:AI-2E family transporter n=1 Tax=Ferruginibacter albus TaxID=2875540 RepID=UPI001CC74091|nr:AI-2E family transporter [Ferruginibacter albus]UAY52990.1 AI-2E family transporter [Ferruginibacter albus]